MSQSTGLVLEGGGLRCMFTNGILDVFMENNITFDTTVGVSAGVLFGCNYKSNQPGRALRYNLKYVHERDYMSWSSWIRTGNFVNTQFAYRTLPYELDPLDFEAYKANPMKFYAVCTDIETGLPVYRLIEDARGEGLTWMRASSSLPVFAQPVCIDGHYYMDGGMTDSIPLRFMQDLGVNKNVVILTQPVNYTKKGLHLHTLLRLWHRQFPRIAELIDVRHTMYNAQLEYVRQQVGTGNTFLIMPDSGLNIGKIEMNGRKMEEIYNMGRKKAEEILPQLRSFLA